MAVQKGDYIGFTIGDHHSSDLGIVRISSSDRYTQNLLPTIQDKTVQVPGGDGTFLFGSYFPSKQFQIEFAFDNLSDQKIRELTTVLSSRKLQKLIFDEDPYKYYWVKPTSQPQLKFLTFDEVDGNTTKRVNKGEGTIDFTAYKPFGYSRYKYLDEYTKSTISEWNDPADPDSDLYVNKHEWAAASGMLEDNPMVEGHEKYDYFIDDGNFGVHTFTYNGGEMETNYKLIIKGVGSETKFIGISSGAMNLRIDGKEDCQLHISQIKLLGADTHVILNSETNLIEGYIYNTEDETWIQSGNLYNNYITAGNFFKLPQGESKIMLSNAITAGYTVNDYFKIEYNYLYY